MPNHPGHKDVSKRIYDFVIRYLAEIPDDDKTYPEKKIIECEEVDIILFICCRLTLESAFIKSGENVDMNVLMENILHACDALKSCCKYIGIDLNKYIVKGQSNKLTVSIYDRDNLNS